MFLQCLGKLDVVEVVEGVNARLETLIVLLGDEEPVERLVDSLVVQVLDRPKVRFDQLQVVVLGEEVDGPCVVQPGGQHQQQVIE